MSPAADSMDRALTLLASEERRKVVVEFTSEL
jgi:hypothetical protein